VTLRVDRPLHDATEIGRLVPTVGEALELAATGGLAEVAR
jgi:hypothetical protein